MRFLVASLLTACLSVGFVLPASASPVSVPAGTKVGIHLLQTLSSDTATPGQAFTFVAAEPVIVNDRVVIRKGANGTGHVASVTKAHGKSAGKLALEVDSIHSVDGSRIELTGNPSSMHGSAQKGKASTATVVSTILLGPVGLFAHNFVKAKNVTVTPSQTIPTWVRSTTSVNVP